MTAPPPALSRIVIGALIAVVAMGTPAAGVAAVIRGHAVHAGRTPNSATSGGAAVGRPQPTPPSSDKAAKPPTATAGGGWYHGVTITQYWPAPESWFVGRLVKAPGLPGLHRIDWLYSAMGVSMEGAGIGLDGALYHLEQPGSGAWVTADGTATSAADGFAAGVPYWRAGAYWRTRSGAVTFPLASGGWSNGPGGRYRRLPGVTFAPGPAAALRFYQSIAVDPKLIPLGSRVYIPAYRNDGRGGWFVAADTGAAIGGRHVDVYRPPPAGPTDVSGTLTGQRIFVVPARSSD